MGIDSQGMARRFAAVLLLVCQAFLLMHVSVPQSYADESVGFEAAEDCMAPEGQEPEQLPRQELVANEAVQSGAVVEHALLPEDSPAKGDDTDAALQSGSIDAELAIRGESTDVELAVDSLEEVQDTYGSGTAEEDSPGPDEGVARFVGEQEAEDGQAIPARLVDVPEFELESVFQACAEGVDWLVAAGEVVAAEEPAEPLGERLAEDVQLNQYEKAVQRGVSPSPQGSAWDITGLKIEATPELGSTVRVAPVKEGEWQDVAFRYTIEVNDGKDVTVLRRYKRGVSDLSFELQRSGNVVVKLEARDYKGKVVYLERALRVPSPVWSLKSVTGNYQTDETSFVPNILGDDRYLRYSYDWKTADGSDGGMIASDGIASEGFAPANGTYDITVRVTGTDGSIQTAQFYYMQGALRGMYNFDVSQSGNHRGDVVTASASGKDERGRALQFRFAMNDSWGRVYKNASGTKASFDIPQAVGPFSVAVQPKGAESSGWASKSINTASVISEMSMMLQNPELPTGCESVALGIALSGFGFNVSKTTIASRYLPYGDSFVTSYVGNPWGAGAGIYPPGLTNTARAYLNDNGSQMSAYNITGAPTSELYSYIDMGIPVVVWNTMGNGYPNNAGYGETYGGRYYPWFYNEHCLVLAGYNVRRSQVLVYDPLAGKVWRDAAQFFTNYRIMGSMAMIIY